MTAQGYCRLAAVIFAVVAALQLTRILMGFDVTIGTVVLPVWASWIAFPVAAVLSWLGFTATRD
ncbi:MAG: hypothetical protein ABL894_02495 [Hyphomicrobium sp.]